MSDKEALIDDDDSFKELQVKWRNNSLTDEEKDLYIKHLTLRHIDKKKSSRELQAENERLKSRYAEICEENDALKEINKVWHEKRFALFMGDDCWIYDEDGENNLQSLVCPVVINPRTLEGLLEKVEQYESTPERGLKAVMGNFGIGAYADAHHMQINTATKCLAETKVRDIMQGIFVITAEDIG